VSIRIRTSRRQQHTRHPPWSRRVQVHTHSDTQSHVLVHKYKYCRQYLYFCTSFCVSICTFVLGPNLSQVHTHSDTQSHALSPHLSRQYLYFCTSKASKLRHSDTQSHALLLRQYLYFCTNKASKRSTSPHALHQAPLRLSYVCTSKATFVLLYQ
jgi:hypothetical protein